MFLQQPVTVSNAAQADLVGTVIGIQADGALRLRCADDIKIIYSELSASTAKEVNFHASTVARYWQYPFKILAHRQW